MLSVTGHVLSADDAAWCLAKGADVVGIGIGAILHHDFAHRALADPRFGPGLSRCPATSSAPSSSGRRSWTTSPPTWTTSSPDMS